MRAFMHELGDPQNAYPTMHVGGTSGKGSTSTMIAAALAASGKRVGLHTKPHLQLDDRARAHRRRRGLRKSALPRTARGMMPAIGAERASARPSNLLRNAACAGVTSTSRRSTSTLPSLKSASADRLDGTNVIVPVVAAITSVGFDHTEVLGDTIEEIALGEGRHCEAGCAAGSRGDACRGGGDDRSNTPAKSGAPVDSRRRRDVDRAVRSRRAKRRTGVRNTHAARRPTISDAHARRVSARNAATAIAVMERLPAALRPSRGEVETGLSRVVIPGRIEVFRAHPSVVFDIAHNGEKAQHLVRFAGRSVPRDAAFTSSSRSAKTKTRARS